jgi:hypothetical protein
VVLRLAVCREIHALQQIAAEFEIRRNESDLSRRNDTAAVWSSLSDGNASDNRLLNFGCNIAYCR